MANIKFLKGYGFSIKVRDNKIVFKNSKMKYKLLKKERWCIEQ